MSSTSAATVIQPNHPIAGNRCIYGCCKKRDVDFLGLGRSSASRNEPREQDIKHFKLMSSWGKNSETGSKKGMATSDAYYQMGCHMVGCSHRDSKYFNQMKTQVSKVKVGDKCYMYHKNYYYEGVFLTEYEEIDNEFIKNSEELKKVYPTSESKLWIGIEEGKVHMKAQIKWNTKKILSAELEDILKHPEKRGFPCQGTILRVL